MVPQVRGLLWKLQSVFNLPKALDAALQKGAIEVAVNKYADAMPLLKRYGHKVSCAKLVAILEVGTRRRGAHGRAAGGGGGGGRPWSSKL